jgi:hypothetical protein
MIPTERTQPTIVAEFRNDENGGRWHAKLPDGRLVRRADARDMEALLKKELPGTSIRWTTGRAVTA